MNAIKFLFTSVMILFFVASNASANATANTGDLYPFNNQAKAQRFAQLSYETRCVVCQNQNLAESNAPMAADLRHKIYQMLLEDKSDAQIKAFLLQRYGEFILFDPPFNLKTMLLWISPFLGLLGLFILIRKSLIE